MKATRFQLGLAWIWIFLLAGTLKLAAGQASLRVVSFVAPEYPPLAEVARISGDVSLEVTLNTDGTVTSSKIVSGHPMLQAAARENLMSWKFAALGSKSLEGESFTVTYQFRFEGESQCGKGPTRVTIESYDQIKVATIPIMICDPTVTITTIKRRHWYWPW